MGILWCEVTPESDDHSDSYRCRIQRELPNDFRALRNVKWLADEWHPFDANGSAQFQIEFFEICHEI